jgi:hypothetical protein
MVLSDIDIVHLPDFVVNYNQREKAKPTKINSIMRHKEELLWKPSP